MSAVWEILVHFIKSISQECYPTNVFCWSSYDIFIKQDKFIYVPNCWTIKQHEDAWDCIMFYYVVGVLLDPKYHEEGLMTVDWSGRRKDRQEMKLENQRHGKTVDYAIKKRVVM